MILPPVTGGEGGRNHQFDPGSRGQADPEPVFVDLLRSPAGNRFLAWQAGTTTLFVVPARQAT